MTLASFSFLHHFMILHPCPQFLTLCSRSVGDCDPSDPVLCSVLLALFTRHPRQTKVGAKWRRGQQQQRSAQPPEWLTALRRRAIIFQRTYVSHMSGFKLFSDKRFSSSGYQIKNTCRWRRPLSRKKEISGDLVFDCIMYLQTKTSVLYIQSFPGDLNTW